MAFNKSILYFLLFAAAVDQSLSLARWADGWMSTPQARQPKRCAPAIEKKQIPVFFAFLRSFAMADGASWLPRVGADEGRSSRSPGGSILSCNRQLLLFLVPPVFRFCRFLVLPTAAAAGRMGHPSGSWPRQRRPGAGSASRRRLGPPRRRPGSGACGGSTGGCFSGVCTHFDLRDMYMKNDCPL